MKWLKYIYAPLELKYFPENFIFFKAPLLFLMALVFCSLGLIPYALDYQIIFVYFQFPSCFRSIFLFLFNHQNFSYLFELLQ